MSDENIVDFKKLHSENTSNKADNIQDRILNCFKLGEKCECVYCSYKDGAAKMVVDFLAMDVMQNEKNQGTKYATFDLKDVFFRAIKVVKEMENELATEEDSED